MTIILHSTGLVVAINGTPARVWQGRTANGIAIHAIIPMLGVDPRNAEAFEAEGLRELHEVAWPNVVSAYAPLHSDS